MTMSNKQPRRYAPALQRAVAYLRMTSHPQYGEPVPRQKDVCHELAKKLNVEVVREFMDVVPPRTPVSKRAEFTKLRKYLRENPDVRYVLMDGPGRITLDSDEVGAIEQNLRREGVSLVTTEEPEEPDHLASMRLLVKRIYQARATGSRIGYGPGAKTGTSDTEGQTNGTY